MYEHRVTAYMRKLHYVLCCRAIKYAITTFNQRINILFFI